MKSPNGWHHYPSDFLQILYTCSLHWEEKVWKMFVHSYAWFLIYQELSLSSLFFNKVSSALWWLFYFSLFCVIPFKLIIREKKNENNHAKSKFNEKFKNLIKTSLKPTEILENWLTVFLKCIFFGSVWCTKNTISKYTINNLSVARR